MSERFDIDPQEVIIRAYQKIEGGWIKHRLRSPQGVCLIGSLEDAVGDVLTEQIRAKFPKPEGMGDERWEVLSHQVACSLRSDFVGIFRGELEKFLPSRTGSVEGWNDAEGRTHEQVLAAMGRCVDSIMKQVAEDEALRAETPQTPPDHVPTTEEPVEEQDGEEVRK